jgi:hypothetical protein
VPWVRGNGFKKRKDRIAIKRWLEICKWIIFIHYRCEKRLI